MCDGLCFRKCVDGRSIGYLDNFDMDHITTSSFRGVWSVEQDGQTVEEDISTATKISTKPLLEDVHDAKTVYVAESSIPGAAEGVFLRRDLGKGSLAAIYNGVRIVK